MATTRQLLVPVIYDPAGLPVPGYFAAQLVDAAGRRLMGQVSPDGEPIAGELRVDTATVPVPLAIVPQTEIAPESWYRLELAGGGRAQVVRVQIPPGATPLTWADLVGLGTPLDPAELSALSLHLADDARHLLPDERDALSAAATPSAGNPLATMADIIAGTGGGTVGYVQDTEPVGAAQKSTWWNPLTQQLKVFDSGLWGSVAPDGGYF